MKIENMTSPIGNTTPNQFIIYGDDGSITFQSYDSKVATIKPEGQLILYSDIWDYSNTTRKYFKGFVERFTTFEYGTKDNWLKEIEKNGFIKVV